MGSLRECSDLTVAQINGILKQYVDEDEADIKQAVQESCVVM